MLHRADAPYVTGRSDVLLKLKLWHDAEATVTGHQPGRGKYAGMLGALRVQPRRQRVYSAGASRAERRNSRRRSSTVITFRYRELNSRGIPVSPVSIACGRNEFLRAPCTCSSMTSPR